MQQGIVLVTKAPYDKQGAYNAFNYCRAALSSQSNALHCIFFYQQGVYNANHLIAPPADEINLYQQWCGLHREYRVPLLVCITAGNRRGILSETEAFAQQREQFSLAAPFEQAGLGEFFSHLHHAQRLVQF